MDAPLPPDLREFLKLLNSKRVEYLLVGGYAVAFHGYPRTTADMDIWIAINPRNAGRVVEVLREFGFNVGALSPKLFLKRDQIVRLGEPPVRIEILTTISGVGFERCYREREEAVIDGIRVGVINFKHLMANKRASGRHKDLDDLENLKRSLRRLQRSTRRGD